MIGYLVLQGNSEALDNELSQILPQMSGLDISFLVC